MFPSGRKRAIPAVSAWKRLAELRARPGLAVPLGNLAQLAEFHGDFVEGRRLAEESLAAARVEENDVSVAEALEVLAWIALFERRHATAAQLADEALRIVLGIGVLGDADSMAVAVLLHASHGNTEDAARLIGAARAHNQRLGFRPLGEETVYSRRFALLEGDIGQERYAALRAEGAALSLDDAVGLVVRALD